MCKPGELIPPSQTNNFLRMSELTQPEVIEGYGARHQPRSPFTIILHYVHIRVIMGSGGGEVGALRHSPYIRAPVPPWGVSLYLNGN